MNKKQNIINNLENILAMQLDGLESYLGSLRFRQMP